MIASVDFCESNYAVLPFIAEFHNAWSSLFLCFLGYVGYSYGNVTREYRYGVMFVLLGVVGFGSFLLHATLHHMGQSADELPMLWINLALLYGLIEHRAPFGKPRIKKLPQIMVMYAFLQSVFYIHYRSLYWVFLVSYISLVIIIIAWLMRLVWKDYKENYTAKQLFIASIFSYVVIGSLLWIYEMNNCDYLLPFYINSFHLSFHVLWHFGAGLGTYLAMTLLVFLRLLALAETPYNKQYVSLTMKFGFLPVCTILPFKIKTKAEQDKVS